MENKEKMTFLQWLDNTWYHYHTAIIIGGLALICCIIGFTQCATRDEHDVFIYSVGFHGLGAQASDEFMRDMENIFTVDYNGDGKKVVDIKIDKFNMVEDQTTGESYVFNPTEQMEKSRAFNLELSNGECVVYIMEKNFFKGNLAYLADLEEELGYMPENAIDGKGIQLSDLDAYYVTDTLGYFPEEYIICLAKNTKNKFGNKQDYYKSNVEFLDNLINCRFSWLSEE